MKFHLSHVLTGLVIILLVACGGSSGGSDVRIVTNTPAVITQQAPIATEQPKQVEDQPTPIPPTPEIINSPTPAAQESSNQDPIPYPITAENTDSLELTGDFNGAGKVWVSPKSYVVASTGDDQMYVWNMRTGDFYWDVSGHNFEIKSLVFSPDGSLIALTTPYDPVAIVIDTMTGAEFYRAEDTWGNAVFSPSGAYLALSIHSYQSSGTYRDGIILLDTRTMSPAFSTTDDLVNVLAFSPDGSLLAVHKDNEIQLLDIPSLSQVSSVSHHAGGVFFNGQGDKLIASAGNEIAVIDIASGATEYLLQGVSPVLNHAGTQFTYLVNTGGGDRVLRFVDISTGVEISGQEQIWLQNGMYDMAYGPDDSILALVGDSTWLWDTKNGAVLNVLDSPSFGPRYIDFAHDGLYLVAGGGSQILLWETYEEAAFRIEAPTPVSIQAPQPAPKVSTLVFAAGVLEQNLDLEIAVINTDGSGYRLLTNDPGMWNLRPRWSHDGSMIAFYSNKDGNSEIYVMNEDGSDRRRLTYNRVDDYYPEWSDDDTQIFFRSGENQDRFVIDLVGGEARPIPDVEAPLGDVSPDSKKNRLCIFTRWLL